MYLGDFAPGATVRGYWNTNAIAGESITRATNGTISVYKDGGTTQSTAGVTDTEDFDSLTGVHLAAIDTSADGTFYSAGSDFAVVLSGATIDGKAINAFLFSFSLNNRTPLRPTTAGRTLDVSAGGEAGVDWANVGSPTTTVGLSGTTVKTATDVETDTVDIQGRLPAALVSGRMDASIGAVAAGVIAAGSFAANALDAVWSTATRVLTAGTNIALAKGSGVTGFNDLDAAGVRGAVGLATANLDTQLDALPTAAENATSVWASGTRTLTAFGFSVTVGTNNDKTGYALSVAGVQAIWDALTSALTTLGSIGKLLVDNVNATISSRSSHSAADVWAVGARTITGGTITTYTGDTPQTGDSFARLGAPAGGVSISGDIAAVQSDTNDIQSRLPAALVSGRVDASVGAVAAGAIDAAAIATGAIDADALSADAVDEILDEQIGDGTLTMRQALRVLVAGMAAKLSGAGTTTITIRNVADTANVVVATVDESGNRTATTVTP